MTFLVPFALLGSLLLIVPIVAHLFKPRKMKETPFSSLRWLKESQQRLSRRIQWHQWLLFLLRAGCLLLLVLALAKPLIGSAWSGRGTDRFIILDVSRSMAYRQPERPSALDRARDLASRIAQTGQASDRTAVILAGRSAKLATPLAADGSASVVSIQAAKPEHADGSLSAALPLIGSLLPRSQDRDVELVFLTDNLQGRWQQKDIQAFLKDGPPTAMVKVIDVGVGAANNAWIADARLLQFGAEDERWIGVEIGCVGEARPRRLRLTGIADAEDEVREVTPKQGQIVRELFKLPQGLNRQGQVAQLRLEPSDALPSDDVFWLHLDAPFSLRVLLVEPDAAGPDGRAAGVFLHTGMEALNGSKNQTIEIARRATASVTAGDFQKADVIVLAGVADLSDAALDALETRVRGGAGLLLFLGPRLNAAFYQQKMHRPQQPAESLLPMIWKDSASDGKPGTLTNVRWAHPLLSAFQDPVLSDFMKSQFRKYYPLTGTPGKGDAILARFDDDVSALIEHPFGAGRVLIFNTSANDEWSDLPRSKSFLPLLDRALAHLSAGGRQRSFTVGDTVILPAKGPGTWAVLTPSGLKMTPRRVTAPGQSLWHLDDIAEAGVYRIKSADETAMVFCVNASRGDSPLRPMDAKALEEWFAPLSLEVLGADTASERLQAPARAWPAWPALVLMAGILLIAETIYVHRLCPRANPKTAAAVVGILKPVGK